MMKYFRMRLFLSLLVFIPLFLFSQPHTGNNLVKIPANSTLQEVVRLAASVTPSERQLNWQRMELTTFLHFSPNTYYDQEWGKGTEDPKLFNPTELDTRQWVKVCKDAGSKCIIITAKHHDGFCLWPSKYTSQSVASSPWKSGKGDIIKELSDECRKEGIGFGIYLSPWDRHEPTYGSDAYNLYFMNQLTELLTQYGKIAEVWFDGACGEGPNGKKQVYDWASYYALIRKLQPEAVIAVMGPDVRWVGTESGYGRETEWSVVPLELSDQDQIASGSQQKASKEGFIPSGDMTQQDLGSRNILMQASQLIWYPSEVDVSIRPGWFWHASENDRVKTPEKLLDIYFSSVGRNSVLLLNIPPDERGLIHENDIKALTGWRAAIDNIFSNNLAGGSVARYEGNIVNPKVLFDGNDNTDLILKHESDSVLFLDLGSSKTFDVLALQENIRNGQHVEKFRVEAQQEGEWKTVVSGTTIGYKRLIRFGAISARYLRLVIEQSRADTYLAELGLYQQLPEVFSEPASGTFRDSLSVKLMCNTDEAEIYYTLDGSDPDKNSPKYQQPIQLKKGATLRYFAIRKDGVTGFVRTSSFGKANYSISLKNAADPSYDGGGPIGLVDGIRGSMDHADGKWTGFSGKKLEATLDLGRQMPVKKISLSLLESTSSWIFKPELVTFETSDDGISFREIQSIKIPVPTKDHAECFTVKAENTVETRYIRVKALPLQSIPAWHPGSGTAAWVFADEIIIE